MADSILRLRVQSEEYDNKLKRASDGIQRYAQKCREVGGTLEVVEKETLDFVKSLGRMETVSKTAKGSLSEMTKAFTDLKMQYKQLTDAEKQSPFGQELNNSLNQLKSRIIETKNDLKGIEGELNGSKFGQFGSVIDTIGHKLGLTTNATELLTSKTALLTGAIGAGAAIVGKAAKEWAAYNAELARQDQITQVTTGLKGDDANNMTDKMRALSDTYKVDFRDAINAANTLMSQFGESGESAIQLIKDGMQGMIKGDGPKLLSMIQQYAPAFRDAGISASQLVAVIQNSEGGIFTDQNMQAIVMGIKNIRLMTNATSEALAKLGIDGQKMSEQMSNGSMTVFDALKQVAGELKNVDSSSKTAGEVMQTVFGRQGAMAGTNLARAIEGLNTDLEQTKKQTGEVGDALADLQTANERLNTAIRDCFEYDGWDQMANGIRSNLITALAAVIEKLAEIRDFFTGKNQIKWDIKTKPGVNNVADDPNVDANGNYIRKPNKGGTIKVVRQTVTPNPIVKPTKPTKPTGGNKTPKTEEQLNNEQIQKLTQEYQKLATAEKTATEAQIKDIGVRKSEIQNEIAKLQERNKELARFASEAKGVNISSDSLPGLTQQLKELQTAQAESSNGEEWENYQKKIEAVTDKINVLKGVLPKDKQATFTLDVNAEQLEQLRILLPTEDKTVRINVEEGTVDLPEVPTDDKTIKVNITADTADAMKQVRDLVSDIEGTSVVIEPKVEIQEQDLRTPFERLQDSIRIKIAEQNMEVDTNTLQTLMQTAIKNGIDSLDPDFASLQEKMREGMNIPDETWQALQDEINEKLKELGIEPIKIDFKTGGLKEVSDDTKAMSKEWQAAGTAISAVGSAMQQIEDPAAKVMGTVAQAIATIALSYAQAASSPAVTGTGWGWIAFAATGLATMISTISAIHSATGYANGGQIKGNSYSGDNILGMVDGGGIVGLNAGEIVLNHAQQGVIASQLENGNGGGMHVVGEIQGEKIVLVANRFLKRSGQGELVTWK